MILVDTSGLVAALFTDQRDHERAAGVLTELDGPFMLSPFVLAEMDYLVTKLAGVEAELTLLDEVARGAYRLVEFGSGDVGLARNVIAQYADLSIGLADASIVVLARSLRVHTLLSLDERHFRAMSGPQGQPFRLLPADL